MKRLPLLLAPLLFACEQPEVMEKGGGATTPPAAPRGEQVTLPPASAPPLAADTGQPVRNLPPLVRLTEIPPAYLGEWNMDRKACGTSLNDSRLVLEPRQLRFWESVGEVERLRFVRGDELEVTASFSGEGETWTATHRFRLDGDRLTTVGDGNLVRFRCPAEPKGAAAHSPANSKQGAT